MQAPTWRLFLRSKGKIMNWEEFLEKELKTEYGISLNKFLEKERKEAEVFPCEEDVFKAFDRCPLEDIKAVIIGQDPYPTPGDAMGLAFSVNEGQKPPRSLNNIFKELHNEFGGVIRTNGDLSDWTKQGVFLLNTVLTVRSHEAGSHRKHGWETITDNAIKLIDGQEQPIVFMLWGNDAQRKETLLTNKNHLVLKAVHPSPLSARRGFFGCDHFRVEF